MKIYLVRLLKGLIYSGMSIFFIFHEHGTNFLGAKVTWASTITKWAENQSSFIAWLASVLYFVVTVASLIYLVKGVYFLLTIHIEKHPAIEIPLSVMFSKPCSGFDNEGNNIERMKVYRNSKMSTMMNSDATKEFKQIAWLDGLTSDNGKHTLAVKRYINSQLSAKSNEEGYKWLKEK